MDSTIKKTKNRKDHGKEKGMVVSTEEGKIERVKKGHRGVKDREKRKNGGRLPLSVLEKESAGGGGRR